MVPDLFNMANCATAAMNLIISYFSASIRQLTHISFRIYSFLYVTGLTQVFWKNRATEKTHF